MSLLFSGRAVFSRTLVGPGFAQWATRIAGNNPSDFGVGITSDSAGNIYVIGIYNSNPLTAYNTPGTSSTIPTLENSGNFDAFVVKYNSSGVAQWATRIAGAGNEYGFGIKVDPTGSYIYVVGYYDSATLTVYNEPGTTSSIPTLAKTGGNDAFVVKYNSSGVAQWATRITAADGNNYGIGIAVDPSGNDIYVIGCYGSIPCTVYNEPGTTSTIPTLANSGNFDAFVVKYNSSGVAQWATRIAGASNDFGLGITVDPTGYIYAAGYYNSNPLTVYNEPGTGSSIPTLQNSGDRDTFVVKYNSSGVAQWASRIAGGTGNSFGLGIAVDPTGYIYVSGFYYSTVTVYNSPGTISTIPTLAISGTRDAFVVKYDSSGVAQWATRIGGTGDDYGFGGITVDPTGSIYVTGYYNSNPCTVYNAPGTSGTLTLANAGSDDVFVVKYNSSGVAQWATRIAGTGNETGYNITNDSSGNIYVIGGYISNPLTVYNEPGTTSTIPNLENSGGYDVFIVKYYSS